MKKTIIALLLGLVAMSAGAQTARKDFIGAWTGKLKAGDMSLAIVLHFEEKGDSLRCLLDSPDQGAKGIPAAIDFMSEDSVAVNVKMAGVTYRGRIREGRLNGTFAQSGLSFPLVLDKGEQEVRRPQNPATPYPYTTEEVVFSNEADHATLAGTLTYPVGFEGMKKRSVPVVLMVTGSGPENRDEEVFDHKPFLVIADYLARNGIASLRYDDRGFGASTGGDRIGNDATSADNMRDAAAGINYLRSTKRFGRVGVLGHSEGGNIAFMLGAAKVVDFAISMAGAGVKGDTALTAQVNRIMELQGQTTKMNTGQFRKTAQAQHNAWLDWFIDYDPAADIAATKCPVLAINGDKDCQVVSEVNLAGIRQALPKNKKSVVKEYASLNHLFQHCQTGLNTEYRGIEETIAQEVLNDIAEWINKTVKR